MKSPLLYIKRDEKQHLLMKMALTIVTQSNKSWGNYFPVHAYLIRL